MPLARKRPEDKSEEWQPAKSVRLYLDDIDDILVVLRRVGPDVHADAGDFAGQITSAEELKQLEAEGYPNLHSLELRAGSESSQILVRLRRPVAVRIEPRDDLRLVGAARQIHELLNVRGVRGSDDDLFMSATFVAGLVAAAWIAVFLDVGPALISVPGVTGLTLAVVFVGASSFFGRTNEPQATVVMAYRREAPSWWEKNKTSVLISFVSNAVVAAVFFALGRWLA